MISNRYPAKSKWFCSAIPASALDEEEDEDEDDPVGETRDDERSGTRYNVWFPRGMHSFLML